MFGAENTIYYKYILSKVEILIPDMETITVQSNSIAGIMMEKDFDNDIHPIIELKIALHPLDIYTIIEHKNDVRFNLRLDKYVYTSESSDSFIFKELSFNEIFAIYIDENTVQLDKKLYAETQATRQTGTDVVDTSKVYSFFLFKEKDIDSARSMNNNIIKSCTITDALAYLFSTANVNTVLMTPLDNQDVYNDVILFPVTLKDNIKALDETYGLYRYGYLLFFDINRTYLIDKRGENTAYGRNEYTNVHIYVYNAGNTDGMRGGFEKDDVNRTYNINILTTSIVMRTSTTIMNETSGTELIMVDSVNDSVETVSPNIQHRGRTKSVVVDKLTLAHSANKFTELEAHERIKETESVFEVSFVGVDIDVLTPNKRFTFIFEDTMNQNKVGGVYRLIKTNMILAPKGSSMNISASCTFLRIR